MFRNADLRKLFVLLLIAGASVAWVGDRAAFAVAPDVITSEADPRRERRPIDLVICLDTSDSMRGLIDSARARLWDVVNSLARAKPTPRLRVGLLTYGSPSRSTASAGWIVRQSDLTSDLDSLYARMMGFNTDGGDEFVGWALHHAVETMNWSNDPRALKLIFIAGNESAEQASEVFNHRHIASSARARGITINAIYCGQSNAGINEHWDQVAAFGGGNYSAIDMHCGTIQIEAPQDRLLLELNMKLNTTYIPFGAHGEAGRLSQVEQDSNAERLGVASRASRTEAKAGALYENAHWDLVDAARDKKDAVRKVKEAELPASMRAMSFEERETYVESQARSRAEVQKQITDLSAERERFLKGARANAAAGKTALDQAMLDSLRTQAEAKGFKFE